MRVVCRQCKTEYDFEETLVSPRGTSVQCTTCGEVFIVLAHGETTSDVSWLIRDESGKETRFDSLRPLQSMLQKGEVTRQDRFSRDGKHWRRIAEITELDEFMKRHGSLPSTTKDPGADDAQVVRVSGQSFARPSKKNTVYGLRERLPSDPSPSPTSLPVPTVSKIPRAPGVPREASVFSEAEAKQSAEQSARQGRSRVSTAGGIAGIPSKGASQASLSEDGTVKPIKPLPSIPVRASEDEGTSSLPPTRQHPIPRASDPSQNAPTRTSRQPTPSDSPADRVTSPDEVPTKRGLGEDVAAAIASARQGTANAREGTANAREGTASARQGTASAPDSNAPESDDFEVDQSAETRVDAQAGIKAAQSLPTRDEPLADDVAGPDRKVSRWPWVVGFVTVVAAAFVFWPSTRSEAPDLSDVDALVAKGTVDGYQQATDRLQTVARSSGDVPAVQARLSRAYALWAQALRFESSAPAAEQAAAEQAAADQPSSQQHVESSAHAARALEHANSALSASSNKDSAEVFIALADAQRLAGNFKEASQALERARRLEGKPSSDLLYVRALIQADQSGEFADARTDAQRALETDANNLSARFVLTHALIARGDLRLAKEQLEQLRSRAPNNPRVLALAQALDAPGSEGSTSDQDASTRDASASPAPAVDSSSTEQAIPHLDAAARAFRAGQLSTAERLYSQARDTSPNRPEPLLGLAELALRRNRLWDAAAFLRRARERAGTDAGVLAKLSTLEASVAHAQRVKSERTTEAATAEKPSKTQATKAQPSKTQTTKPSTTKTSAAKSEASTPSTSKVESPTSPSSSESPIHDNPYD